MFIDSFKIFLHKSDYVIDDPSFLDISPCRFDTITGKRLWTSIGCRSDGKKVFGSSARLYDSYLNKRKTYVWYCPKGLYISGSIAYYLSGGVHNLLDCTRDNLACVISDIQARLKQKGTKANISAGSWHRLDSGKHLSLSGEVKEYYPAVAHRPFFRHRQKVEFDPDLNCIKAGNKQWQFILYNKRACCDDKQMPIPPGFGGNHLARAELRFLTSRKIKSKLGFKTVGGLLDNFGRLESVLDDYFTKLF